MDQQPVSIGKPRLIRNRLKPVCRGVFEEVPKKMNLLTL